MGEVNYFNKGKQRKAQIYDWLDNVIIANNLNFFVNDIKVLFVAGKDRESFKRFAELIDHMTATQPTKENGDTLAYLIEKNMDNFGRTRIIIDLFNGVILPQLPQRKERIKEPKVIKGESIKEFIETEKEIKEKARTTFGINKQGNRERGIVKVRIAKSGKPIKFLISSKTGRFLKQTEAFKKGE